MKNNFTAVVYKKEMKDIFRDKKTIFMQILIPLIIFPVIALVMSFVMDDMKESSKEPSDIVIMSEEKSNFSEYLRKHPQINEVKNKKPEKALKDLDITAIVKIPKGIDKIATNESNEEIEVIYVGNSQDSSMALSKVQEAVNAYSKAIVEKRLESKGVDQELLTPIKIEETSRGKDNGAGTFIFAMIVPMLLMVYAATGGIAAATDLGAGEKERQTLEPLLTTKANRLSILIGKYFAVVTSSVIGTLASIAGLGIAGKINPEFLGSSSELGFRQIVLSIVLFIGVALIFSGIELSISFYARNFKEAQTYLTPITFLVLIPSYLTMSIDGLKIPYKMFHIPIVNIIALFKESIYGIFSPLHILTVLAWVIVYLVLSAFLTIRMFNNEKVIFRNS